MIDGLRFEPKYHSYFYQDRLVPSVSRIVKGAGLGADYSAIPPAVLEKARRRGVYAHTICEATDRGELVEVPDEFVGLAQSYTTFLATTQFTPHATEEPLVHLDYFYAGTPDVWGDLQGAHAVVDRKAVAKMDESYALQLTAYAVLVEHRTGRAVDALYGLHLQRNGSIARLIDYTPLRGEAWATFRAALELYHNPNSPEIETAKEQIAQWRAQHMKG